MHVSSDAGRTHIYYILEVASGEGHAVFVNIRSILREQMALKIFAGDFRSGSTGPNGFRLKLCDGTENQAELIPLSNVQTLERFDNTSEVMRSEKWGIGTATPSLSVLMKLIADCKNTSVPFIVSFKDGRRMIASVEREFGTSWL